MATTAQIQKCIDTVAPLARAEYMKGKKILPSVCIAQACNESAYMTSPKMVKANALFGIKVGKSKVRFGKGWKGKSYSTKTKEVYNGITESITDNFRAYDTVAEAVEDYYDMLMTCSRYKAAIGKTNPKEVITAIKNAGYATDPNYVSTIMSIINKNTLTQYDNFSSNVDVKVSAGDYYPAYKGKSTSLLDAFEEMGIQKDFEFRKTLATRNGIVTTPNLYWGSADQNVAMLILLKEGKLKRLVGRSYNHA